MLPIVFRKMDILVTKFRFGRDFSSVYVWFFFENSRIVGVFGSGNISIKKDPRKNVLI